MGLGKYEKRALENQCPLLSCSNRMIIQLPGLLPQQLRQPLVYD